MQFSFIFLTLIQKVLASVFLPQCHLPSVSIHQSVKKTFQSEHCRLGPGWLHFPPRKSQWEWPAGSVQHHQGCPRWLALVSSFLEMLRGLKEELAEFSETANQVESMKSLATCSLNSDLKLQSASLLSWRRNTDRLTMPLYCPEHKEGGQDSSHMDNKNIQYWGVKGEAKDMRSSTRTCKHYWMSVLKLTLQNRWTELSILS